MPTSQTINSAPEDDTVSSSGEVVLQKWVNLSFASGGYDLKILVKPGEIVTQDMLLASVNDLSAKAARDAPVHSLPEPRQAWNA